MHTSTSVEREAETRVPTTLDQMKVSSRALVAGLIPGNFGIAEKLASMGLVAGTPVQVLRAAPFGDPISIRLLGYTLSLRLSEAKHVLVLPA